MYSVVPLTILCQSTVSAGHLAVTSSHYIYLFLEIKNILQNVIRAFDRFFQFILNSGYTSPHLRCQFQFTVTCGSFKEAVFTSDKVMYRTKSI